MTRHSRTTDSEILAQLPAARRRAETARRKGLRAESAWYDRKSGRILVELTDGFLFGFPATIVPGLESATGAQIAAVEVLPGGSGLAWDELDADISVPGLLMSRIGRKEKARELARIAGTATSAAKARSSRLNGAKGGRPRKTARAR